MPFTLSFDVASPQGLADLDAFIRGRSYVVGFSASQTDVELFNALGKAPEAAKYPNLARYYNHIASFSADARKAFPAAFGGKAAAAGAGAGAAKKAEVKKVAAPAPAEEEDDAADLFGDDDDDAAAKKIAAKAAAAKKDEAKDKKPAKKEEIAKSAVIYEVKTLEAGQDMNELEAKLRAIEMDGLLWGQEFKVVDVAYGIQKLVVQAIIEDEKVPLEDFEEKILSLKDHVQSVDLQSMNKVAGR